MTLDRAIRLCLAKNPDERWQSARDVGLELRGVTEQSAVAASSLLVATGALWTGRQPARDTAVPLRLSIPWTDPAWAVLNLAPDGRHLIHTAFPTRGRPHVLRDLAGTESYAIAGSEAWESPEFWSPDGRSIAFALQGKLQKMPIAGGPMELICALPDAVQSGSWGSGGTLLLATNKGLLQVPATGGTPSPALHDAPPGDQLRPKFLPDGRQFIFYLRADDAGKTGTYIASPGGTPRRILPNDDAIYARQGEVEAIVYSGRGLWMQRFDSRAGELSGEPVKLDDSTGSVSASQAGVVMWQSNSPERSELVWLDRGGKKLGTLPAPETASNPKISWQGNRVAYTAQSAREISYTEAGRGVVRSVASGEATVLHPLWSADGSKIVFASKGLILMRDADTDASPIEIAKWPKGSAAYLHDWTRDGRYITYAWFPPGGGINLSALPMTGDKASGDAFLVLHSPQRTAHTSVSPDSRWVAYSTNEGDHYQVFVAPLADQTKVQGRGPRWQVSTEGGVDPNWSPDGKQIFYLSNDFKKLMTVDFKPGAPPSFSLPRALFDWTFSWNPALRNRYAVDPATGRFLAVNRLSQTYSPITALVNWAGLLKKN